MIKKKYLSGLFLSLLALLSACGNKNQNQLTNVVVLNENVLPLIEKRPLIQPHLEGNLTNEIKDDQKNQSDNFFDETPTEQSPLPPPVSDEEEPNTIGDNPPNPNPETGIFMEQMEQEVVDLVNNLRKELDLPLLEQSKELRLTARIKSKDMYDYQYFDHQGHLTFSQLLEESQVVVKITGENIYRSQSPLTTAKIIFDTWKNSSTHYENMINEQFHYIGVGIYSVNNEGIITYVATQHLTD